MKNSVKKIIEVFASLCLLDDKFNISEVYPYYNPYSFFTTYYMEVYSSFKRNPNMWNKGRLQSLWELMVQLLGSRANTIKNSVETKYAQNKNR